MADKSPPRTAPGGEAQPSSKKDSKGQDPSTHKISEKPQPPPSEGKPQPSSTQDSKNSKDSNNSKKSTNSKDQHPPTRKTADKSHVQPSPPPDSPESTKDGKDGKESHPSSREKLLSELSEHIQAAEAAASLASSIKEKADSLPEDAAEEKAHLLEEAQKQEKIYAKEIKVANRLQSGVWQGGAAGAGMGAGVGAGVGTVVGSLVGGVVSIPTTGLGLLGGAATGAVHGPWVKMPKVPNLSGGEGEDAEGEETVAEKEERKV